MRVDDRQSIEFGRLVNLSDALYAVAMTLLVFKVEVPRGGASASDLAAAWPQAWAFLLSFAVVANFWWHHHSLFRMLDAIEPGLMVINMALLGAVTLVPLPTELIGRQPGATAPAILYIGLMVVMSLLHLLLVRRADHLSVWREEVPPDVGVQLTVGWSAMIGVSLLAMLVAARAPVVGLAMLLLTGPADRLALRRRRNSSGASDALVSGSPARADAG